MHSTTRPFPISGPLSSKVQLIHCGEGRTKSLVSVQTLFDLTCSFSVPFSWYNSRDDLDVSCTSPLLSLVLLVVPSHLIMRLLDDASDETSGDGAATLTNVETHTLLDSDGLVDLADHLDVVTGHDHLAILGALGPGEGSGLVSSTDEHLGLVVVCEAGVAATLLLGQDVHGGKELLVGFDGAGLGNDHATEDVITLDTTEEETGVVTSAGLVAGLLEGLDVGNLGLDGNLVLADKLNLGILLQDTALDTARGDGTTAGDREDVLDGHQERLSDVALGGGDPGVDVLKELIDLLNTNVVLAVLDGAKSRAHDDGSLVTLEAVGGKQLAHLHLDKLQHLLVLNSIDLVDEDDDALDTDLTGEEQVLPGLRHLSVAGGNDNDGTVHGSSTSNHVLDVIGVTGAVNVGVMPVVGGVLDVCGGDGDTTLALLRRLVDGAIVEVGGVALLGLTLGDGGCEGGLWRVSIAIFRLDGFERAQQRDRRTLP